MCIITQFNDHNICIFDYAQKIQVALALKAFGKNDVLSSTN